MVTWFYFSVFILILIMIGIYLLRNKNNDTVFMLFCITVVINCLGRYLVASADTLEMAIWANKFTYVGGCFAPLFTLMILAKLCKIKIPRILLIILTIYSTIVLGLVMTIGYNDLYYKEVTLVNGNGFNYLEKVYAPLHILYPIMMILYALIMIVFIVYGIRHKRSLSYREIIVISTLAFSVFALYLVEKIIDLNIDLFSVSYFIGIVLLIKYYERINMYDMHANIYSSIEKMDEYGYISFDNKYRYTNSNKFAKKLFPEIEDWIVDEVVEPSESFLYKEVIKYLISIKENEIRRKTIKVGESYYQLTVREISYGKKRCVGYLLEFINRTMEKKYYNAIEEYNISMKEEVDRKTKELLIQQEKTQKLFMQTVIALSDAVDAKDRYTSGHSKRVAEYSKMIAKMMGKTKEEQEEIYRAGILHDVGKIRIPAEIINKQGKLTDEEYNLIKIHPITGYHILRGISENSGIAMGAKYHHERYDGKGYPNGFVGDNIPEVARIIGVADAYDAMASNRSYRKALPQDVIRSEIEKGKGTQFDPVIADVMIQIIDEDKNYTLKENDSDIKRILTVDDEMINNKIIAHIMSDEPMYQVYSVTSGFEAVEKLKEQEFDLILLDVLMPEMNGFQTLKCIRDICQTPVVLMTSDKSLDAYDESFAYGYDDYITKPFLPLLLKEVVYNMTKKENLDKQ